MALPGQDLRPRDKTEVENGSRSEGDLIEGPAPTGDSQSADAERETKHVVVQVQEEEFKEGGYGWVVVLSVFLLNANTWGLNASYSVFLSHYLNSGTFPHSDPIVLAFVGGLSFSIALLVSPLCTVMIGRWGTRPTMAIGIVVESVALVGASFTQKIWHLLLSQGVAFGLGMGFTFNATVSIIPQWFRRRRSFANSIATSGSGFGGLAFALGSNAMINKLGLPWAFRVLAIICFVVSGVCCALFRDRNKAVGSVHRAFHGGVLRRKEYWILSTWAWFFMFGYVVIIFSVADYCVTMGMSDNQGSLAAAMFSLSQGFSRPLIGFLSDKFGPINMTAISTLLASLSTFLVWTFAGKYFAGMIVFTLAFGGSTGAIWPVIAPVTTEIVGLQLLPSAFSFLWLLLVIPGTFAEPIAIAIKGKGADPYLGIQMLTGTVYAIAFCCIWTLRAWKIQDLDIRAAQHDDRDPSGAEQRDIKSAWDLKNMAKGLLAIRRHI